MSAFPLPTGWALASIADVIREVRTTDPSTEPNVEITYFDIGSIENEAGRVSNAKTVLGADAASRARQIVQAGDVLFSTVRPNLRAIALVPEVTNGIASTGFCVLRAAQSIHPHYLYFYARSEGFLDALLPLARGVSYPAVRSSDVVSQTIPVAPAAEQTRIVEKLEELLSDLDAGVAEMKAAQKKLTQYRQSLLKAAVEGGLTAQWRAAQSSGQPAASTESGAALLARILTERRSRWEARQLAKFEAQGKTPPKDWQAKYPAPVAPDIAGLPELPDGWTWASVDQCSLDASSITDGPFGSNLKSSHYRKTGPLVVRLKNIGDGEFVNADAHISIEHFELLRKHAILERDVLVAMLGEVLPRACIAPEGISPAIVKADCARIRVNQNLIFPSILNMTLNSKPTRDRVAGLVKGIGRPRINLGHIRSIAIPVPSIAEQVQIDLALRRGVESINQQSIALDLSLKQSAAQRKSILQAAFSGQLVPQDPNDEPASALLARIGAERAERAKQPKVRKTKQPKEIVTVVNKLIDVLAKAGDWVPAQEAFRRCGVADGALTEQIEEIYAELRDLDKTGRLAVEAVTDGQGRKLHDRLKLLAG